LTTILLFIAVQEPQAEPVEPRHWDNGQLAWSRMPLPEYPVREIGTVQAELTFTVAEQGRVRDCRVDRLAPGRTRFGREVIRSVGRARLSGGRARPGDTMTFVIWACGPASEGERCQKIDWPTPVQ
jgi:hypothetical protein